MKYEYRHVLVLQFPEKFMDFEKRAELEEWINTSLKGGKAKADLDGYDWGSGEVNFFVFTDDPHDSFKSIMELPEEKLGKKMREVLKVAYRENRDTADTYVILWPKGLKKFKVK
jgi:hypothetical protein